MADPSAAIPKWVKITIRTVGIANLILVVLGTLFLADSFRFFLTYTADPTTPYFRFAFIAITLINVAFLVILLVTAVRFIQGRTSSINSYSLVVFVLVAYGYANGVLWRTGRGIGMSIAAATGVGNLGVAPFEFCFLVPYLYPVASIVLLQVLKRSCSNQHTLVSAGR
ncbi:MAG: hypothetical protein ABSG34_01675 [Candidatus Sulfotelmatobacter sp.]|jgi:hypothetical protein